MTDFSTIPGSIAIVSLLIELDIEQEHFTLSYSIKCNKDYEDKFVDLGQQYDSFEEAYHAYKILKAQLWKDLP